MCNLYSITKGQQAIRDLAGAMRDLTGNLPMLPGVFPDYSAPIVRTAVDGVRELAVTRWGMPSPAFAIAGKPDRGGAARGSRAPLCESSHGFFTAKPGDCGEGSGRDRVGCIQNLYVR
jgi:putative SOS response-associated peptidase YedK